MGGAKIGREGLSVWRDWSHPSEWKALSRETKEGQSLNGRGPMLGEFHLGNFSLGKNGAQGHRDWASLERRLEVGLVEGGERARPNFC